MERISQLTPEESSIITKEAVWPLLAPSLGGGVYESLEGSSAGDSEFKQRLDRICGIDGFQHLLVGEQQFTALVPFASRVQDVKYADHRTFTIRITNTPGLIGYAEWQKYKELGRNGWKWLHPVYLMHAYYDVASNRVISAAAVKTQQLVEFVLDQERRNAIFGARSKFGNVYMGSHSETETVFYCVPWKLLQDHGIPLHIYG